MSYAEQTAYMLYDKYHFDTIDDDVRRCLALLLTMPHVPAETQDRVEEIEFRTPRVPASYEEAMAMGAEDVEMVREDLHKYAGELAKEFNMK